MLAWLVRCFVSYYPVVSWGSFFCTHWCSSLEIKVKSRGTRLIICIKGEDPFQRVFKDKVVGDGKATRVLAAESKLSPYWQLLYVLVENCLSDNTDDLTTQQNQLQISFSSHPSWCLSCYLMHCYILGCVKMQIWCCYMDLCSSFSAGLHLRKNICAETRSNELLVSPSSHFHGERRSFNYCSVG